MASIEQQIVEWLERDGRIPDDAFEQLQRQTEGGLEDQEVMTAIVERCLADRPELSARRRIALSIQTRVQARGGRLSADEWKQLVERAHAAGWDADDVDRLVQTAIDRSNPAASTPRNEKRRDTHRSTDGSVRQTTVGDADPGGGRSNRGLISGAAVVGLVLLVGGVWLFGGNGETHSDTATDAVSSAASPEQIVEAQRLLVRLGEAVPETGRFDPATRAALDRALPEFAGMGELEPWLIEQLQIALQRRDDDAWAAAQAADTVDAIEDYLARFPAGTHVSAAYERLDLIDAAAERTTVILEIQQELNRLGRATEETGTLDAATMTALQGFPGPMPDRTRAGLSETLDALRTLRRWPVESGETFRDCLLCPEMIAIPAGRFLMGSPETERMRSSTEGPQHEVSIERFALATTEITYGHWLPCVNEGVCPDLPIPSDGDLRRLPISHVSVTDALLYLRWLRERTGFDYRLPTEAEWEYAARAGTTTRYATGDCIRDEQANFDARLPTRDCPAGLYRGRAIEVASFPPNAFGLFDMHGNMLEPVQDCWNLDYVGAPTDGSAWNTGNCGRSPLRGGSWSSTDRELRSAARIRPGGIERNPQTGLRVAVSLPAPSETD
jgi:serine/threonine-protein kinase